MQYLRRHTLLDDGLIVALIVTGVLWALSRSAAPPDQAAIEANLDVMAWDQAMDLAVNAAITGSLDGVRSALRSASNAAEAAGDAIGAGGMLSLAAALPRVDLTAVEQGLIEIVPFPESRLFALAYLAIWTPLFYPPIPTGAPEAGAEWAQINVLTPTEPTTQYWGTARWYQPESVADSAGEADIDIPELGLTGKLMFAIDGGDILITLVFTGPLDDARIVGTTAFWIVEGRTQKDLVGAPPVVGDGFVQVALAPQARDDNVDALRTADEISVRIDFIGDRYYVLRIELGESGRALLGRSLGGV